ncbi:MAG: acetyl-CoA synthase subunit gamma, partial [Ruminococcaceae bacterium]|nr:acetyl-CoA synthase subunit gamma [Oscillospiraceae bacterium]
MALKGLDIFKLSPKTNCKECGNPTCMAFCMKVAQGAVSIDKCPHFSAEALATLNSATAPLMKTITVGEHKLGGETVLFRHEKTLVNKNMFAVCLCTDCADKADEKIAELMKVDYERIGERMYVEFIHVANKQADPAVYAELVKKAAATGRDLVLECWDVECAKAALAVCGKNVILDGATPDNWEAMNAVATSAGVALGVWAENISDLYDTVKNLEAKGNKNLVLDVTGKTAKETLANAVNVRRTALKQEDRTFGYPSIVNVAKIAKGDSRLQTALAAMFVEKYAS